MKTTLRRMIALTLACSALLLAGHAPAAEDRPPGQIVNVGSHRMHILCIGSGQPTVVMDAGLGGSLLDWSLVQPLIAGYTRVCAYDRSGYGWSEASSKSRSSLHIAYELHALLKQAQVAPPYVLVGHSFGGFNVRVFASRYRELIAGLVLIDSSHEAQFERFERQFGINLAPKRSGRIRLSPSRIPKGMPIELHEVAMHRAIRPAAMLALRNELMNFRRSAREVEQHGELPDVPLVIITRGQHQWHGAPRSAEMEMLWLELQHSLTKLATDRKHIIAARSGHYVHLDQPELVGRTIQQVVRRVRGRQVSWQMLAQFGARFY